MDGHAAMVGLANTFYLADTTGWKHSYHALVTLKAVVNPSLVIPHPYSGFVENKQRRKEEKKKQSRPVKKPEKAFLKVQKVPTLCRKELKEVPWPAIEWGYETLL